jgi:hypothetical protein
LGQVPADQLAAQGVTVDWPYVLRQFWSVGLGLPDADRVVKKAGPMEPNDWRWENAMARVNRAGELQVSPQDDHQAHVQGHTALLDHPGLTADARTAMQQHIQQHIGLAIAAEAAAMQQSLQTLAGPPPPPAPDGMPGAPAGPGPLPGPPGNVAPMGGPPPDGGAPPPAMGPPPGGPPPPPMGPPPPSPLAALAPLLAPALGPLLAGPRRRTPANPLGLRPPAPLGQGRIGKTRDIADVLRQLPRLPRLG